MNIEYENKNITLIKLSEIKVGDIFKYKNNLFLKIEKIKKFRDESAYNCISIDKVWEYNEYLFVPYEIYSLDEDEKVEHIDSKLIIYK